MSADFSLENCDEPADNESFMQRFWAGKIVTRGIRQNPKPVKRAARKIVKRPF